MKTIYFHEIEFPCLDRVEDGYVVIYDDEADCDWKCKFPLALSEKGVDAVIAWLNVNNPQMTLAFEYTDEI